MALSSDTIIRFLTIATLAGLLFSAGLGLSWMQISASLRQNRLLWILPANFLVVPALAGVLTGLFPLLSAFLTPVVCEFSLKPLEHVSALKFNVASIFLVLFSTITLPLAAGTIFNHFSPSLARIMLKPIRAFSEAIGAVALVFVIFSEFHSFQSI